MTDEAVDQFLVFIQDTLDLGVPFAVLWDVRRESFPTMKHLRKVISWLDEGDRAAVWDSRVTCHYLVLRNPLVRAGIGLMARVANAPQPVRCASSDAEALVFAQACARPARVLSARDAEMRMHRAEDLSASAQSAEAAVAQSAEAAAQVATGTPPRRAISHAAMDPRATSSPAGAPTSPCDDAPSLQHETTLHVPRHHDEAEAQRRIQIGGDEAEAQRRIQIGGDEAEAQRRIRIGQLELRWPRQRSGA